MLGLVVLLSLGCLRDDLIALWIALERGPSASRIPGGAITASEARSVRLRLALASSSSQIFRVSVSSAMLFPVGPSVVSFAPSLSGAASFRPYRPDCFVHVVSGLPHYKAHSPRCLFLPIERAGREPRAPDQHSLVLLGMVHYSKAQQLARLERKKDNKGRKARGTPQAWK
eukprot:1143587-Pelagomonas_calceolata.AAC.2